MIDYLLHFEDEAAAIAALADLRTEDGWRGDVLTVALVTAEAEFGEPDRDGLPELTSPRQQRDGFFLLVSEAGHPGEIAAIQRVTGAIVEGDQSLAGARIDPAWAGSEAMLSVSVVEPAPEPVPASISDRQFAHQLAILGTITQVEALAWAARGDLPDAMNIAIEGLPPAERFSARMLLSSATGYERSHPLVPVLAVLLGYDEADLDDLWRAAGLL